MCSATPPTQTRTTNHTGAARGEVSEAEAGGRPVTGGLSLLPGTMATRPSALHFGRALRQPWEGMVGNPESLCLPVERRW